MSSVVVLDSSAVLAYLRDEPGADDVERVLLEAEASDTQHLMTSVNWAEVLYIAARRFELEDVAPAVAAVDQLPIGVVDAKRGLALQAARLKHTYGLGLADGFAAALALLLDAPLLAKDADFDVLRNEGLKLQRLG